MDVTSGDLNAPVYRTGQRAGHYESWYLRANHPERALAFWLRYTIFAPAGRPADAVGELWAVAFDGSAGAHAVGKVRLPLAECSFAGFPLRVGSAELGADRLAGRAGPVSWELDYRGDDPAMQVAGFDDAPDSFLELATAKATLAGPVTTPWATTLVLRHEGREYSFVGLRQALRARASYAPFAWDFATRDRDVRITGRIEAEPGAFVGLRYDDPPGGVKHCLNTKIASARVTLETGGRRLQLRTSHRALFEILTDDAPVRGEVHGVPLRA